MRRRAFTALAIAALVFGAMAQPAAVAGVRRSPDSADRRGARSIPAAAGAHRPQRVMDVMVELADEPCQPGWRCQRHGTTVTASQRNNCANADPGQPESGRRCRPQVGRYRHQPDAGCVRRHPRPRKAADSDLARLDGGRDRHPPDPRSTSRLSPRACRTLGAPGRNFDRLHRRGRQDRVSSTTGIDYNTTPTFGGRATRPTTRTAWPRHTLPATDAAVRLWPSRAPRFPWATTRRR